MADMMDPKRYVLVSSFLPHFSLFYCPADGTYVMNEIPDTALFKRKAEALAVARALERRQRKRATAGHETGCRNWPVDWAARKSRLGQEASPGHCCAPSFGSPLDG
jgi:hypothetical protein